ncbi:RagB/SusD family nutrient uptake outer membrane protein [Chitinophagaceae bacterium 26-R-25]|nr:RagB/SusD family nutrient uptake outer membrane protein [Chitinophagaceae bacterium 26-R-25]
MILTCMSSCNKFLDVQPQDKLLEPQIYSTPKNVYTALNGLYMILGDKDGALYGETLTLKVPDILAQRYNIYGNSMHIYYTLANYTYADATVSGVMGAIWAAAYRTIFGANTFITNLDANPGVLTPQMDSICRGEAIAMRAMLHFDMLRLFGPRYNYVDSVALSIPYYTHPNVQINPLLPANQVMDSILTDLNKAEGLLSQDPVITNGVMYNINTSDFMQNRNYRFNYFAVKALQARVNMYRGDKPAALAAAKVIIGSSTKFPWYVSNKNNFSAEMIMGVSAINLTKSFQTFFITDLDENNILAPSDISLKAVYENSTIGTNDFRGANSQSWQTGTHPYLTFCNYKSGFKGLYPNTIPLLKKSEMFYIAAECEPDLTQATGYLDSVRVQRNLPYSGTLTATTLQTEIQKEYQKDFFGEGQLFYYYKRNNVTSIPSGSGTGNITIPAANYVVPLPQSEITNRQIN